MSPFFLAFGNIPWLGPMVPVSLQFHVQKASIPHEIFHEKLFPWVWWVHILTMAIFSDTLRHILLKYWPWHQMEMTSVPLSMCMTNGSHLRVNSMSQIFWQVERSMIRADGSCARQCHVEKSSIPRETLLQGIFWAILMSSCHWLFGHNLPKSWP